MKPITLNIEGLNSYIEMQEIDFKTLTSKGLFGIFGKTGSGKSTILDAITFALYGIISRNHKEYINTNCSSLFVGYKFEIGVGDVRKAYLIERSYRKNIHGDTMHRFSKLYECDGDEKRIIAENKSDVNSCVEDILGLKSADFTRSVVIPQGKFSDFLQLSGANKRNMLERIFGLEKYGRRMTEKIRNVKTNQEQKKSVIEGQLNRYEGVSKEELAIKQKELNKVAEEQKVLQKEKENIGCQYEIYNELIKYKLELDNHEQIKKQLDQSKDKVEFDRININKAQKAKIIKPKIDKLKSKDKEIKVNQDELKISKEKLENLRNKYIQIEKKNKEAINKLKNDIPILSIKKQDLNKAIVIEENSIKLKTEKTNLNQNHEQMKLEIKQIDKKIKENELQKLKLEEELNLVESKIKENSFDIQYKQKIEEAVEVERVFYEKQLEIKKTKEKIEKEEIKLKEIEKTHQQININNEVKEKILKDTENKLSQLQKNNPGDLKLLTLKQQELNDSKKQVEQLLKDKKAQEETQIKFKQYKESTNKNQLKIKEIEEALKVFKIYKQKLEDEINHMKKMNLASDLAKQLREGDSCPVCGNIHHLNLATSMNNEFIIDKEKDLLQLNNDMNKNEEYLNEIKSKKIFEDIQLLSCENELIGLDKILKGVNIEKLEKQVENKEESFEKLQKEISNWNEQKELLQQTYSNLIKEKGSVEKELAKYDEKKKVSINNLKEYKEEYQLLNKDYISLKQKYDDLVLEYKVSKFSEEKQILNKKEKQLDMFWKKKKEIDKLIKNLIESISLQEKPRSELLIKIEKIGTILIEKDNQIKKCNEEIYEYTDGKEITSYIKEVDEQIKNIKDEADKTSEMLNQVVEDGQNQKEIYAKSQQKIESLGNQLKEINEEMDVLIAEYKFISRQQVLDSFIDDETLQKLINKITDYDEKYSQIIININSLKEKLKDKEVTNEKWQEIKDNKNKIEFAYNNKIKQIASLKTEIKRLEIDLEKMKFILDDQIKINKKLSLLDDIDKLIQGNKFVEFVAKNQLKYITREASKRLQDISGRYKLEINDVGDFIIIDNKNGGAKRDTASLSGGETFVTSLALALALSSNIQLKGNAPLEFFFLDEGFGSLDAELLETVMISLEKLHNDKLAVGIISHVEELKNRVPMKLIVKQAEYGESGTKVLLEQS